MGTRNLTMVIQDAETKVAQYGQFDGYPGGQGSIVLNFLHRMDNNRRYSISEKMLKPREVTEDLNLDTFKEQVRKVRFVTEEEAEKFESEASMMGEEFYTLHPAFTRDTASEILEHIYTGKSQILVNSINFVNDSLFCEWAYLIDLDNDVLEVYEGFVKEPLDKDQRFYIEGRPEKGEYYPIKCVAKWPLDALPSEPDFMDMLMPPDEEE